MINFPWDTLVNRRPDFDILVNQTWILTILYIVLALLLTIIVCERIPFQPNNRDTTQRRIVTGVIVLVFALFIIFYNQFVVTPFIKKKAFILEFMDLQSFGVAWQNLLVFLGTYLIILFGLARTLFKNKKTGTIF